jgi:hypothetical protein
MVQPETPDRALVDMRDQRDHLRVQLSLLKDTQRSQPADIARVQRELDILEQRISKHRPAEA